ncbi:hypothetical protein VPHD292_0098 [Vibrio phage D292]
MSRLDHLIKMNHSNVWLASAWIDRYVRHAPEYIKRYYISICAHYESNSSNTYLGLKYE